MEGTALSPYFLVTHELV